MTIDVANLTIRPMTASDVPPLAESLGWPEFGIAHRWREQEAGQREMFVAEVDGVPIGSVSTNEEDIVPGLLHLFALDVAEALRRRRIGTALVQRIEREASDRGLSGVYLEVGLDNTDALRLHERLGYLPEGEPFDKGWYPPNEDGTPGEWYSEFVQRMFKRFPA